VTTRHFSTILIVSSKQQQFKISVVGIFFSKFLAGKLIKKDLVELRLKMIENQYQSQSKPVMWVNIPITRTVNTLVNNVSPQHHVSPKKVRWSEDLTQIREISPRCKNVPWKFMVPSNNKNKNQPSNDQKCNGQHFICKPGKPCMMKSSESSPNNKSTTTTTTQFNCSPQLQKVVLRAVNNNNSNNQNNNNSNYWRPDRSNLSLTLRPTLV